MTICTYAPFTPTKHVKINQVLKLKKKRDKDNMNTGLYKGFKLTLTRLFCNLSSKQLLSRKQSLTKRFLTCESFGVNGALVSSKLRVQSLSLSERISTWVTSVVSRETFRAKEKRSLCLCSQGTRDEHLILIDERLASRDENFILSDEHRVPRKSSNSANNKCLLFKLGMFTTKIIEHE